jgi:membrane-associated phospholipid phosphatase
MKRILNILFSVLLLFNPGYAQTSADSLQVELSNSDTIVIYSMPKWHESITNIPGDFVSAGKTLFSKKSLGPVLTIAGSTAVLYLFDQALVDGAQQFSRHIGLDSKNIFKTVIRIGDLKVMERPGNLNTGFYFIGEGWTSVLLFGGIGLHGAFTNNSNELRLLSQALEGFVEISIVTQLLKRSFGRETPERASIARGKFRPFPSLSDYQSNVARYDAMPSGHMATIALTVTLLAEHYPDNRWIRPVGYSLMGICAFSMLNNGVHWASDYPLGFGIGYLFAKTVAKRGRIFHNSPNSILNKVELSPTVLYNYNLGLSLSLKL